MENTNEVFTIKLSAATVIDGEIAVAGEVIEVSEREARNLVGRGRATLVEADGLAEIERRAQEEGEQIRLAQEAQLAAQIAANKLNLEAYNLRTQELDKLNVDALKTLAADKGHDLGEATKKADIIAAIQAAEQAA